MGHGALADVAVHAVPSEMTEDDLKITATLQPRARRSPRRSCSAGASTSCRTSRCPRYIEFRDELPRSPGRPGAQARAARRGRHRRRPGTPTPPASPTRSGDGVPAHPRRQHDGSLLGPARALPAGTGARGRPARAAARIPCRSWRAPSIGVRRPCCPMWSGTWTTTSSSWPTRRAVSSLPALSADCTDECERSCSNAASVPPEGGGGIDCMKPRHREGLELAMKIGERLRQAHRHRPAQDRPGRVSGCVRWQAAHRRRVARS